MKSLLKYVSTLFLPSILGLISVTSTTVLCAAPPAEKAMLRLSWKVGGEFVPFIVAWDKGFYAEEGIDMTIEEGGGSSATLMSVGAGKETFGVCSSKVSFPGIAKGVPVIQIMTGDSGSEDAIITLKSSNISLPADLKGKKVANSGSSGDASFKAFLGMNGLSEKDVQYIIVGEQRFEALLSGRVDAILATPTNDLPRLVQMGAVGSKAPVTMAYSKFGVPQAVDGIICSLDTYKNKKDLIRRFVKASVRGINHTFLDMEDAVDRCVKRFPMTDRKSLLVGLAAYKWLQPAPVGWQDPKEATALCELIEKYMGIKEIVNTPKSKLYTNEFLPY